MLFLYSFFSMLNLICSPLKELIFAYVYFNYGDHVLLCFYWFVGVCYYWHDKSEWGKSWWYLCGLETSTWDILWKPDIEEESISVIFVISLELWTVFMNCERIKIFFQSFDFRLASFSNTVMDFTAERECKKHIDQDYGSDLLHVW